MNSARRILAGSALIAALALGACAPRIVVHGYVPVQEDLAEILPGVDTVFSVEERIGRPSSTSLLGESSWYYVQTTVSHLTYHAPKVIDREVIAILFDEDGVVSDLGRYGLEDGRIINLNTRTTVVDAKKKSILGQIFGNLLNVNAENLIDN